MEKHASVDYLRARNYGKTRGIKDCVWNERKRCVPAFLEWKDLI